MMQKDSGECLRDECTFKRVSIKEASSLLLLELATQVWRGQPVGLHSDMKATISASTAHIRILRKFFFILLTFRIKLRIYG